MNFTYENANLESIIKKYKKDIYNYNVEYMDGSKVDYVCYSDEEEQRLKDIMIKQALERQEKMNFSRIKALKCINLQMSIIFSFAFSLFKGNNNGLLSFLILTLLTINIYYYRVNSRKLKELKKYKMVLEVFQDKEYGDLFQKSFEINKLDELDYREIKIFYKEYKILKKD